VNKRQWALLALAALVAVDLVLIYLVLRPPRITQAAPAILPPAELVVTPTPTAAGIPQDTIVETAPPVPANMLIVRPDGSLYLAEGSSCEGPQAEMWSLPAGSLEWVNAELPGDVIMRFDQLGNNVFSVSSPTADCAETWFRSSTGESLNWGEQRAPIGVFSLRQTPTGASVSTLIGDLPSPCNGETIALTALDQDARLACGDGQIFSLSGASGQWVPLSVVDQVRALTFAAEGGLMYAVSSTDQCNGLAISQSTDAGVNWQVTGCAEYADSYDAIGLAATGNDVVLVDTNRVPYRSVDGGRTLEVGR